MKIALSGVFNRDIENQPKHEGSDVNEDHLYRRGVGVMLLNHQNLVWVGRRIDNTDEAWQMPQGGIDVGEEPWATALRELEEETGIAPHLVERIATCPERLRYDLPPELRGTLWKGQWKGQLQDWFLCRFLGREADVDIATDHAEFCEWKWVAPSELPELIVPFKRDLYRRLLVEFSEFLPEVSRGGGPPKAVEGFFDGGS
ncbi:MAG: RNA pyrophosphohydrolase [Sphingomicrobium sp.]|nr:RNA pyrophosphohydrolase [Sphingomonadales bacterium]